MAKAKKRSEFNYVPYTGPPQLPAYGTTPEERAAYRKAVREQRDRERGAA